MAIDNFKKEDLVGRSLDRLLDEIESVSQEGTENSYDRLKAFVGELEKVASDATLKVTRENGQKDMAIRDSEINLISTIKNITDKINTGIDGNAANQTQAQKRDELRELMDTSIGVLLKQDEIMQELVEKGMTDQEFIRNAENEIKRSDEKLADLKPLLDDRKKLLGKFGNTVHLDNIDKYTSKSQIDSLAHNKSSKEKLDAVSTKLALIENYKQAMDSMDPTSQDFANNKTAVEVLVKDIKGLAKDLKALDLYTNAKGTAANASRGKSIDFTYLENLSVDKDLAEFQVASQTTNILHKSSFTATDKSIDELIQDDYNNIKETMKTEPAKFGYTNAAEIDALTNAEIDAKITALKEEVKHVEDEIKYEEAYKDQTKESIEKFKAKSQREAELSGKFHKVKRTVTVPKMVEKKDAQGNPVIGADGNPVMEQLMTEKKNAQGEIEYDDDGNPIMEPVMEDVEREVEEITPDARKDYLAAAGISDEAAYRQTKLDDARARAEAEEAGLSTAKKRELMRNLYKADNKLHPIKWLRSQFFTNSMWKAEYSNQYLAEAISDEQEKANLDVDAEIRSKIGNTVEKDAAERHKISTEMAIVRDAYKKAIMEAVSQEKMTDELYRGQSEDHVKEGAKRAAMNLALDVVSDSEMLYALRQKHAGKISQDEYDKIEQGYNDTINRRVKMDDKQRQDRAHADHITNPTTSRKVNTPTFEDR